MKKMYLFILLLIVFVLGYKAVVSFVSADHITAGLTEQSDITPPEFKGGPAAFSHYRNSHLKYPAEAYWNKIEGVVLVSCTIDVDGTVKNPSIIKSQDSRLNEEALRFVAGSSGEWIPASRNGENIAQEKTVSVSFYLSKAAMVEHQFERGKKEVLLSIMGSLFLVGLLYYVTVNIYGKM